MNKLCSLFVILLFAINSYAQDYNLIDKTDLKSYIEILASDSLDGRYTGSIGQKKAANYLAIQFAKIGLTHFIEDSYFEEFELEQSQWKEIYIRTNTKTLYNNKEISYIGNTEQKNGKEIEIVFGGKGTKEELDQINVKNRMVLIFSENMRTNYSISDDLISRQAYGMILANPYNEKQFSAIRRSKGNFILKKRIKMPEKDTLTGTYFRFFQDFIISNKQVKSIFGISISKLNKYIESNSISKCPTTKIFVKTERNTEIITTENVVGILPGKTDTCIIISAHYDHLGRKGDVYYPGADDNASGISSLLELAETFSKVQNRKYTMVFLATTGEEEGLFGSYIHANNESFEPQKVLVNINMDMIGRKDEHNTNPEFTSENYVYAIGTGIYPNLKPILEKADIEYPNCIFDYSQNNGDKCPWLYRASDQYSFYKKNIPAIFFFTGLHSDYHQSTDTPEKINYDVLTNRVRLIGHVIEEFQK